MDLPTCEGTLARVHAGLGVPPAGKTRAVLAEAFESMASHAKLSEFSLSLSDVKHQWVVNTPSLEGYAAVARLRRAAYRSDARLDQT